MTLLTQHQLLISLLSRKRGTTAMEVAQVVKTTCPHKRISELRHAGWTIVKKQMPGASYHVYFGTAPKGRK